ncbi:MAG TPA: ribonuclease E/G, partial [Pseudomonadales bacterium]
MKQEILINVSPSETRVAVVENGVLQEVYIEREARQGLVGNIYRGKVLRVLPGMQSAFVDIGLDKAAFLHAKEIFPLQESEAGSVSDDIKDLIREGQEIIVQVVKDMIGSKGARLTTHISLPSRYLVYMPGSQHIGVSQRIDDEKERERLRNIVKQVQQDKQTLSGGFILRTAADGVSEAEIKKDMEFVTKLWGLVASRV